MMSLIAIERKGAAVVSQASNSQKEYDRVAKEKEKFKEDSTSKDARLKELEATVANLKLSEKALKQQAENTEKECIFTSFITLYPSLFMAYALAIEIDSMIH